MVTVNANNGFKPYHKLIEMTIYTVLIKTGYYGVEEKEDLFQRVMENLLLRQEKIVSAYKGVAKFEGYLYVVVRRICINLSQKDDKQKKRINTVSIDDIGYQAEDPSVHADHRLMIKEAVTRFGIILNTYRNNRSKLIFCLKALYRFPVTTIGLNTEGLAPDAVKTIQRIVNEINDKSSSAANLQIYQQLALLFGTLERRTITDDAQRHWIDFYINQIIKAMNGEPPRSSFEKETFRLLFERWINNR